MSDDTDNRGAQDPARGAGEQDYEVRHFAEKHGIIVERAQELIEQHRNSRDELAAAAERLEV